MTGKMRLLGISIISCLRHIIVIPENRITLPNESEILLYLYSITRDFGIHSFLFNQFPFFFS